MFLVTYRVSHENGKCLGQGEVHIRTAFNHVDAWNRAFNVLMRRQELFVILSTEEINT
ncbi:hypothetical protein KAR91_68280 [Candidatus Pacearchaeota archaeon]|nr:hypothetical protein [Candidatus Pacearchaeota archaeon]